jgi:hypothetical protein
MDRKKVIKELEELCEYLFHEYEICYHGDKEDIYNRFLIADNALDLLKEQEAEIEQLNRFVNGFSRDAMPVVRCKDCVYYLNMDKPKSLPCRITEKHPDWFCADGKRVLK